MKKLFLDDTRNPPDLGWDVVRSYDAFVAYIEKHGCPDVISFDHDLAFEHYPLSEDSPNAKKIPYDTYTEKTGLHAARWLIEKGYKPRYWSVHSLNPVGKYNIRVEMHRHCPEGEIPPAWRPK